MSAFLISQIVVKDADKMKEYGEKAGQTIKEHGGRIVLRGGYVKALAGAGAPHNTGIIEFPDLATVEAWFASDGYQALIALRDAACDMTLTVYQAPT